jgi:hypothetical protein
VAQNRVLGQMLRCLAFVFAVSIYSSCGLETYSIIEPPIIGRITSGTYDATDRYFSFRTIGKPDTGEIAFLGTAVFYKIYASESVMNSDVSSVENANTQYSMEGFNRITSLGYQELGSSNRNYPLVPADNVVTDVIIRLFNEGSHTARISENDSGVLPTWGSPVRRSTGSGNGGGFNFFASSQSEKEDNPVPISGDSDVNYSGFSNGTVWYVNAYAASVGRDIDFANLYSQLIHLGYIRISSN